MLKVPRHGVRRLFPVLHSDKWTQTRAHGGVESGSEWGTKSRAAAKAVVNPDALKSGAAAKLALSGGNQVKLELSSGNQVKLALSGGNQVNTVISGGTRVKLSLCDGHQLKKTYLLEGSGAQVDVHSEDNLVVGALNTAGWPRCECRRLAAF